jgi:hypothetical protein
MGGTDDPSNIIEVSIERHAELHYNLWMSFGHWQDKLAWEGLTKRIDSEQMLRESISRANKGRPKSEEQRRQHSEFMKGNKYGQGNKGKPNHQSGLKRSNETKELMRQKALGRPRVSCLACKKQNLPVPNWVQHHKEKCYVTHGQITKEQ